MLANFGKTISKKTENLQQNRNTYSKKNSQNGENFAKKKPNTKPKHEDVVCKPCVID